MGPDGEKTTLAVRYSNVFDRALLLMRRRQDEPEQEKWKRLYEALPLPTFVGSCTSDPAKVSSTTLDGN
jgi:hypothetical protein